MSSAKKSRELERKRERKRQKENERGRETGQIRTFCLRSVEIASGWNAAFDSEYQNTVFRVRKNGGEGYVLVRVRVNGLHRCVESFAMVQRSTNGALAGRRLSENSRDKR